jgi:hypothetical protein
VAQVREPGKTLAHIEFTKDGRYALASLWENDGALIVYDARTFKEVKRLPMSKPVGKYNVWNKITRSEGTWARRRRPRCTSAPATAAPSISRRRVLPRRRRQQLRQRRTSPRHRPVPAAPGRQPRPFEPRVRAEAPAAGLQDRPTRPVVWPPHAPDSPRAADRRCPRRDPAAQRVAWPC